MISHRLLTELPITKIVAACEHFLARKSCELHAFDGTYDQKFFDANGNQVAEDMGTIHGTRLSVSQFAEESNATASK